MHIFLCYYHCNYLVITDRSFSSVMPSGWSAVGLVPEWELIITFDEETHVPVMSEPARLQVTSMLFNKSTPPPPTNSIANTLSSFSCTRDHTQLPLFPLCHRAVVKYSTKTMLGMKLSVCSQALECSWPKRCNQEIDSTHALFQC